MPRATALTSAAVSACNRQVHADIDPRRTVREAADGIVFLQLGGATLFLRKLVLLSGRRQEHAARVQRHVLETGTESVVRFQRL